VGGLGAIKIKLSKGQLDRENHTLAKRLLNQNDELTRLRACLELAEKSLVEISQNENWEHPTQLSGKARQALAEIARVRKA